MYHFDCHIMYAYHAYLRLSRSSTNSECDQISAPTIYPVSESEYCMYCSNNQSSSYAMLSTLENLPIHPSIHPSIYPSIYFSIFPSIYLSIHVFIHSSKNVYIQLFIHQSIHLFLHLSYSSSHVHQRQLAFVIIYLRFHSIRSAKL
jgi:hypothetical protein